MGVTIGLLSDTHGVFDPAAAAHLKGTHLLLHAGDVGSHGGHQEVLNHYATAAGVPILAVAGNVDDRLDSVSRQLLPTHRLIQQGGWSILLVHIVASGPHTPVDPEAATLIQSLKPDIVVFGHSHKPGCWKSDGTVFINPGSAGPARFKLPRTCATLQLPSKDCHHSRACNSNSSSSSSGGSSGGGKAGALSGHQKSAHSNMAHMETGSSSMEAMITMDASGVLVADGMVLAFHKLPQKAPPRVAVSK